MQHNNKAPIGFYVHTHGFGHAMRVSTIINHLDRPTTVFSSFKEPWPNFPQDTSFLQLPSEDLVDPRFKQPKTPDHYHYLPLGVEGVSQRLAAIAVWIAQQRPDFIFVDVSAEVAQMVRLCSVPVGIPRMHGKRNDCAHLAAYDAASVLIAPFPAWAEQDDVPQWVKEKTVYTGAICRFFDIDHNSKQLNKQEYVLIMTGGCEDAIDVEKIISWAEGFPEMDWIIIGNYLSSDIEKTFRCPKNLMLKKYVPDPECYIKHARYIIAPCSDNITAEISFFGKPWICIPFNRPFDEQVEKSKILDKENVAVVHHNWPNRSKLEYLMHKSDALDFDKQQTYVNPLAGQTVATTIENFITNHRIEVEMKEAQLVDS